MGISSRRDVMHRMGKPIRSIEMGKESSNPPEVWADYHVASAPVTGTLTAVFDARKNRLLRMDLVPDQPLSREDLINTLGHRYVVTKYDFDTCLGDKESAPLFESPEGGLEVIEYRDRGIAAVLSGEPAHVSHVIYLGAPLGSRSSRCAGNGSDR